MAAATRPPRRTIVRKTRLKEALRNAPSVAPKCTNGTYCTNEAAPAVDTNADKVLATPVFTSNSFSIR